MDAGQAPGTLVAEDDYHALLGANTSVQQLQEQLGSHAFATIRLEFPQDTVAARQNMFAVEPFLDRTLQDGFEKRLQHMPGFWCCRQPDGPLGKGGSPYSPLIMRKGIEYRS